MGFPFLSFGRRVDEVGSGDVWLKTIGKRRETRERRRKGHELGHGDIVRGREGAVEFAVTV